MEKVKLPKDFIEKGSHVEIIIRNREGEEITRALVDHGDVEILHCYKWRLRDKRGYVSNKEGIMIHRLLMNPPLKMVVDHINHNPLDNRRVNLRVVTNSQNLMNMRNRRNIPKGIDERGKGRWRSQIWNGIKNIHLGYFDSIEEAIVAREFAEKELFGEYALKKASDL